MEFPEGNANYCFWSVHSTPAGIDMPYQHASAALSETPLGALIFARALFGSCWLSWMCDSDEQQDFSLCPRQGHGHCTAVSWGECLEAPPLRGRKCFTWKIGLDIEEARVVLGEGRSPSVGLRPPGRQLPCPASQCREEKRPFG